MRIIAIAISITVLILYLTAVPSAFSQDTSSDLFLEISDDSIDPGETVSITISAILDSNLTREVMMRFVPPQGSVQQYPLHLRADSPSFASESFDYPNGVPDASTQQSGNYIVLVQDLQRETLVGSSFEVEDTEFLEHPFVLLFVGAIFSGVLIPFFTRKYQIHQKGLEIRINLVGRISQTVMGMITTIDSIVNNKRFEELDEEYRKFRVESAAIWAELESYFPNEKKNFPNEETGDKWHKLVEEIGKFYVRPKKDLVAEKVVKDIAEPDIENKKREFERKKKDFLHEKYVIMQLVLNRPMPRFSVLPGFLVRSSLNTRLVKRRLRRLLDVEKSSD